MMKLKWINQFKTLYGFLVVLLFWYILHLAVASSAIPSPFQTIINFIEIFPGELSIHLSVSFLRITAAILISLVAGSIIGLWIGMSKKADELVSPIVYILYPLPKIAFLPILMILFGLGNTPKIVLIITIVVFQIIVAVRDGVKEIPKELFYSVMSLGLSRLEIYRHLIVPAVLPKIITAIRISVGVSISVLFYGENFATTYGIGYFIMDSWIKVNYVEMFSGILALSIMGFVIFKLIDVMEARLCGWIKIGK
ncbi:ABC transporter permease [Bacillus tuaregi]|uniref:ABC transporter permease n=1 Tax=Bacillus tuaregi TaxID=1816695 RepID=UPI000A0213F6|nr:ABC transporter permease [Bacillus tuaregi]